MPVLGKRDKKNDNQIRIMDRVRQAFSPQIESALKILENQQNVKEESTETLIWHQDNPDTLIPINYDKYSGGIPQNQGFGTETFTFESDKGIVQINQNTTYNFTINDPDQNKVLETQVYVFVFIILALMGIILLLIYFLFKLVMKKEEEKPMTPANINIGILTKQLIQYQTQGGAQKENIVVSP